MSLLDEGFEAVSEAAPEDQGETGTETEQQGTEGSQWFWDENTPGQGERPQFLPEKYKSVADVAKAYKELESRLGVAPSSYDFSKGESWIESDHPQFVELAEFAKSKHVPQEVMDKFLGSFGSYLNEFKTDINQEKTKLGENASERLKKLNNWARSNLSEKAFLSLSSRMNTAESIEALEEIRDKMLGQGTFIPGGNDAAISTSLTIEDYRAELRENLQQYENDPAYRKKMEAKLYRIVGNK